MEISSCPLARHDARRELHSRPLKIRAFIFAAVVSVLAAHLSATDAPDLDFKQWGLLAIQDGGRRKPVDTFAKETLIRVQQEALSVSDRLTLLVHVMDGSALLIVPAPANETDPWVEPSGWSRYYSEAQFAPIRVQLQTVVTGYVNADPFNFSRAAN